jgi:hypothetical protein
MLTDRPLRNALSWPIHEVKLLILSGKSSIYDNGAKQNYLKLFNHGCTQILKAFTH